jgi:hypothetical protein
MSIAIGEIIINPKHLQLFDFECFNLVPNYDSWPHSRFDTP